MDLQRDPPLKQNNRSTTDASDSLGKDRLPSFNRREVRTGL